MIDNDLELRTDWEIHVGPDISGVANPPLPTSKGWRDLAGTREFYVKGPGGADVLYAVHRPLQSNAGIVKLSFDLMTDVSTVSVGRCLEVDTIFTFNKLKYNCSSQFNNASGVFEISNASGGWVSTGLKVQRFTPFQWYSLQFEYWFDSVAKRYSFLAMTLNGKKFSIPLNLQNLAAIATDWADVISLQVQLDVDTAGGGFSIFTRKMQYIWE
jgi:hypothetical protein